MDVSRIELIEWLVSSWNVHVRACRVVCFVALFACRRYLFFVQRFASIPNSSSTSRQYYNSRANGMQLPALEVALAESCELPVLSLSGGE